MREIKFRAWDKETRTMLGLVHQINFLNKQLWAEGNGEHSFCCHLDKYELMQYTGLHDKNGKEIYEHDLVRGWRGTVYEVVWQEGRYMFFDFKAWEHGYYDAYCEVTEMGQIENTSEVIGNIYENKELLEVK